MIHDGIGYIRVVGWLVLALLGHKIPWADALDVGLMNISCSSGIRIAILYSY